MNLESSYKEIAELLSAHEEWLLIGELGKSFALRVDEIELIFEREKLLLEFLDEKGFQMWRVLDWKYERGKLHFDLTGSFGREHRKISLVPRILAAELTEDLELARLDKANKIADLIVSSQSKANLIRVGLNQETGRFAQIIFELYPEKQIAALSDVSGEATSEILLTTAILWLEKLQARKKNSVEKIWILSEGKTSTDLGKLHALLHGKWKSKIAIFEISGENADTNSELEITRRELSFTALWREKSKKIQEIKTLELTETAQRIIDLAPWEIDVVFTKHGETLRFLGLPFARVRRMFDEERAWFGTENKRQILNEKTFEEFAELIENLKTYRRFDSPNKRHAFYHFATESWLESLLRKNIKQLDANLILSPVYNQFRVSNDKIDLLALRRDGRLIIIELKTSADREMLYQAADYWRKVELQRRAGNLQKAKIFGDKEISDKPALIYLVAPTLSFHRDFEFLARTISKELEIARFNLNENWRENLKVMGRKMMGNA